MYQSADESCIGNDGATSVQAAGIDKVTIGTGDLFDFDGLSVLLKTYTPLNKTIADGEGQLTAASFMDAIAEAIVEEEGKAFLVKVTDQDRQAGSDGSFSGTYLIVTVDDGEFSANDYIVQLVGVNNVTATGAVGGSDIVML